MHTIPPCNPMLLTVALFLVAGCSPNYKLSVEPPECAVSPASSDCREHQYSPVVEDDKTEK